MYHNEKLDLMAFGQAVKEAREGKGFSRERFGEMLYLSPRLLIRIKKPAKKRRNYNRKKPAKIYSTVFLT